MDTGIIASIKLRYRKRQITRALHFLNINTEEMYKIDQTTTMRWIAEIWN